MSARSKDATATITGAPLLKARNRSPAPPEETAREHRNELVFETTAPNMASAERAPGSEERPSDKAPRVPERSPLDELPRALKERFDSVTLLGEGGMGTVYRARDRKLGREVAIKLIYGADVKTGWRFLQEVRAQARIEHPHVCKVFEVGTEGGLRFIVMQLVHGQPLDKAKEEMTTEQKVKIIKEAATAVHEAHRAGFIHRDIKPGNIMVERGEDGGYKPYVMDFGLARELEAWGQTMTGSISGTPAFMAPEQARGEVRALDRRTDVFSLGATLYDLLAGRPPFIGGSLIELLRRVGRDEAQPIRQVNRAISEDLETIVMKCLEREPNRRYDSARALAEDLQRYLDGEPVRARRASVGYWLVKKLRKHRLAAALLTVMLAISAVVATLWVRSARRAEEQAKLSQELGADLKEMELYMRYAYGLPLHDIDQDRDIVRGRLRAIEERMIRMGPAAEGPGNYALGRGYLSLREPEAALRHLRASAASGYASPELELAMGQALGELYKKALDDTRRIQEPERRKARVREIEVELRDPALGHLRAAVGSRLGAPAYVEGLIAFYEGKHEEARAKAREALVQSPWLHEAEVLVGDTHYAEGSLFRMDADFDRPKMLAHWKPAEEAYAKAEVIARSDPSVYEAQCELGIQDILAYTGILDSPEESFERAKAACEKAVTASSRSSSARVKRARAYAAYSLSWGISSEAQPHVIGKAIELAEEAARASPNDVMAQYTLGVAWRSKATRMLSDNSGEIRRRAADNAVVAYSRALTLDPQFFSAMRELAEVYAWRAGLEFVSGRDSIPSIERALELNDRAALLAPPSHTFHLDQKCVLLGYIPWILLTRGQSPTHAAERAIATCEAVVVRGKFGYQFAYKGIGTAYLYDAEYAVATGADPSSILERVRALAETWLKADPTSSVAWGTLQDLHVIAARYTIQRGDDPEPHLRKAREICRDLLKREGVNWGVEIADIELTTIQWAMKTGTAREADFEVALAHLERMSAEDPWTETQRFQRMAAILERRAVFRFEGGKSPASDIERGLAMTERVFSINPRHADTLAARGGLYLVRAKSARDPATKAEAARLSRASFTDAFQGNPLLEREHGAAAREAARLEGERGSPTP